MGPRRLAAMVALATLASSAAALYSNGSVIAPCDSPLYCQGDILKAIELARPFKDSKQFVDMPTKKPLAEVIAAYHKLSQPLSNNTELNKFLDDYFQDAGDELDDDFSEAELETAPVFLGGIDDEAVKEFVEQVIDIWPSLTRRYKGHGNCSACVSSFLPVNRTFVVAGGRFREPYYWDSYWVIEGLLRTGGAYTQISKDIIENFLDFVNEIGFVPNGARRYYLNRSQPPLLTEMVKAYVEYTNDTSILARAVPLLIKEHDFWTVNRTVSVTAANGKTYSLNRYSVLNNQPRPESYREDYNTANNQSYWAESGIIYPAKGNLSEVEKEALYANLASGAESGWDYSSRWLMRPNDAAKDVYFPLRFLNVRDMIPVDLNSILYQNEATISDFLKQAGNETGAQAWASLAAKRSEAMTALMWNETLYSYFDYNLTDHTQRRFVPLDKDTTATEDLGAPEGYQVLFDVAQFYPFWTGAAPDHIKNNPFAVQQAFSRVKTLLDEKKGAVPSTNFRTGQQWDEPNVWPPLQHILMKGLLNTPATFGEDDPAYLAVQELSLRLAQRYLDSTFCTWRATGGSTSVTAKIEGTTADGIMFEKYSDDDINAAGGGGEYEVVEGFGWTNGVLIWAVDTFGNKLVQPNCGNITAATTKEDAEQKRSVQQRAVELDAWDARRVKKFGKRALKK